MATLSSCHCCGLVQSIPSPTAGQTPVCCRCHSRLRHRTRSRNHWTAILAATALALYPAAMLLPMLKIERLGLSSQDSLLNGVMTMWAEGYWFIGTVVFLFSVIVPPLKLIALWLLSTQATLAGRHRAAVYHLVEFLGRWGMLDVMLVAVLIAFVKLGDLITIQAGSGLAVFAVMVLLSLLASMTFNPLLMWDDTERTTQ